MHVAMPSIATTKLLAESEVLTVLLADETKDLQKKEPISMVVHYYNRDAIHGSCEICMLCAL